MSSARPHVWIYDNGQGALSLAWMAGGRLLPRPRRSIGSGSWDVVYDHLWEARLELGDIGQVSFCGHGYPGRPQISRLTPDLGELKRSARLTPDALWWWRACDVFQGQDGQQYAVRCVRELGCQVAGHTRVVSGRADGSWNLSTVFYQSGLYGLRPGELPHWSLDDEGGSRKNAPHTVSFLAHTVPDWAWQSGPRAL